MILFKFAQTVYIPVVYIKQYKIASGMLLAENLNKDIGKDPSFCVLFQSSDF